MTQQVESTRKLGRTIRKTLGAFLCFLAIAWLWLTPPLLHASSAEFCDGYCTARCGGEGGSCASSGVNIYSDGSWSCYGWCSGG